LDNRVQYIKKIISRGIINFASYSVTRWITFPYPT